MTPVRQFIALAITAILVAGALMALNRGGHNDPVVAGVPSAPPPSPSSGPASDTGTVARPPARPSERAGEFSVGASGSGDAGMDAGDILEPMAAQLADLLEHVRDQCGAVRRGGRPPVLSAATPCVNAGEAAASTVEFVRGTLASAAGRDVSGSVRSRWTRDLDAAAVEIRASLTPVQALLGQALASGAPSPAAFREFAHMRDRIGRVLAYLDRP